MKLVTLLENTGCRADMIPQHGLSLYIETGNRKILFDMGQDDTFARNAEILGIDLAQVDIAVLSHGHYDHGGGLREFLRINQKANVYLHREAFGQHYKGTEKYIGLDPALCENPRLIFTEGKVRLSPELLLTDCNDCGWQNSSYGLTSKEGSTFRPDAFRHEQYLQITEGKRHILISGCSHKGIGNIARHFQPDVLIGGFHLNKVEDTSVLECMAKELPAECIYYTGHCTGEKQFAVMKQILGDHLRKLSTGTVIEA